MAIFSRRQSCSLRGVRLLVYIFPAAWTVAASNTQAAVTSFVDGSELVVQFNGVNNNFVTFNVTASGGFVKVNGLNPFTGAAAAASIDKITIVGTLGRDLINLTGVTRDNFPNMRDISVDAGGGDDDIMGSEFDDELNGGDGDDVIFGFEGNDTLDGGAGDDEIHGADGQDIIHGGDGNDLLFGDLDDDQIFGDDGNDVIDGQIGNDLLDGGKGDDFITGGSGNDILTGGKGNDQILANADDDIIVWNKGDGFLAATGGLGIDTIRINGDDSPETFTSINGDSGVLQISRNDTIVVRVIEIEVLQIDGGGGDDMILPGDMRNIEDLLSVSIAGGDGNDTIDASAMQPDELNLIMNGGAGNDILIGSPSGDVIAGGEDDDILRGKGGQDSIFGDAGNDLITWAPGDAGDIVHGGTGNDRLLISDSDQSSIFTVATPGNNRVILETTTPDVALIELSTIETLDIDAHGGNDILNVNLIVPITNLLLVDLDGGEGNDTIGFQATTLQTAVRAMGGNGADHFELYGPGKKLDGINGPIDLIGVGPEDRLNIDNSGSLDPITIILTPTSVNLGGITFLNSDAPPGEVIVRGSAVDDVIHIDYGPTAPRSAALRGPVANRLTVFGLTGSDVFHVTPSEDTVMFLDGGNAFIDTLNFSAPGLMVHQSRFLLMTEGRQDVGIINFENVLIDGIVTPNAADHWQFYE